MNKFVFFNKLSIILIGLIFLAYELPAQKEVIKLPRSLLKTTRSTKLEKLKIIKGNNLKGVPWQIFIDKKNVALYKDSNLKRVELKKNVEFLKAYYVFNISDSGLHIIKKEDVEGLIIKSGSKPLGWINKKDVIAWPDPLYNYNKKMSLKVILKSSDLTQKDFYTQTNKFDKLFIEKNPYYIFNVYKVYGNQVLIAPTDRISTLDKKNFCWVNEKYVHYLESRLGVTPNRKLFIENKQVRPLVFKKKRDIEKFLLNQNYNDYIKKFDTILPSDGFPIIEIYKAKDKKSNVAKVKWQLNNDFNETFLLVKNQSNITPSHFEKAFLMDRQNEYSQIVEILKKLSSAKDKKDFYQILENLYYKKTIELKGQSNLSIDENTTIYSLFEKLTDFQFDLEDNDNSPLYFKDFLASNFRFNPQDFIGFREKLKNSLNQLQNIEKGGDFPFEYAPYGYTHYWVPVHFLPLEAFLNAKYIRRAPQKREIFVLEAEKNYNSFKLIYIDNSFSDMQSNDLPSRIITKFNAISSDFEQDNNQNGNLTFISDGVQPVLGSGKGFIEVVAQQLMEKRGEFPSKFEDKKHLRNSLYQKNFKINETLEFHFFVTNKFYQEYIEKSTPNILQELVREFYLITEAKNCKVKLYLDSRNKDGFKLDKKIFEVLEQETPEITYHIIEI